MRNGWALPNGESRNAEEMQNTRELSISSRHRFADHYLKRVLATAEADGTMTLVRRPEKPASGCAFNFLMKRRRMAGSAIGGIRETQEMLDFCGKHGITSDIELIPIRRSTMLTSGC